MEYRINNKAHTLNMLRRYAKYTPLVAGYIDLLQATRIENE